MHSSPRYWISILFSPRQGPMALINDLTMSPAPIVSMDVQHCWGSTMRLFCSARGAVVEAEARGIMATAHVAHVRGHCFQSVSFAVASSSLRLVRFEDRAFQCHCLIVVVQVFDHWSNVTQWQKTLMGQMFGNTDSWLITWCCDGERWFLVSMREILASQQALGSVCVS